MLAHKQNERGFNLIEAAIVLTIIALIVGGILVGQNLIRESQLRSVSVDAGKISTGVLAFREKYSAFPGDMPNAISIWGADSGCASGVATDATPSNTVKKTATCDGDNDGKIDDDFNVPGSLYERFRAIQQLANANLIWGSYTGVMGPGGASDAVVGINMPASRISGGGFTLRYLGNYSDSDRFLNDYGHIIYFGTAPNNNSGTKYPIITPAEAWSIDTKIDDGLPAYGNVIGWKASSTFNPGCTTTDVETTAVYATTTAGTKCSLIIKTGF